MHAEVYRGRGGYYWRFRSRGRITANNEAFASRGNALRAVRGVVRGVLKAAGYPPPEFAVERPVDEVTVMRWSSPRRRGDSLIRWPG